MNEHINSCTKTTNASPSGNYNLDKIVYDLGNVSDLLNTIRYLMADLDYGSGEKRNHPLQRISSLVEVTADISERLLDATLDSVTEIRRQIGAHHA